MRVVCIFLAIVAVANAQQRRLLYNQEIEAGAGAPGYGSITAETFTAEYKEDRLDKAASTGVAMGFTVMSLGIVVVTRSLHADPPSHAAPLS